MALHGCVVGLKHKFGGTAGADVSRTPFVKSSLRAVYAEAFEIDRKMRRQTDRSLILPNF